MVHISSRMHKRMLLRVLTLLLAATLFLMPGGCDKSDDGGDGAVTVNPARWTFNAPEAFLDHLRSLPDRRQRAEMLSQMYARTDGEQWAVQYLGAAVEAEFELIDALRDEFGHDSAITAENQLRPASFVTLTDEARIEPHGDTRAMIRFTNENGEEDVIVLARIRGAWTPHATTLSDGETISFRWCNVRQDEFTARIQYARDVTMDVRNGTYDTAAQALQSLAQKLSGPPPRRGTVVVQ